MTPAVVAAAARSLASYQVRHPVRVLVAALCLTIASIPLISQLSLRGDLTALLPETKPSVVDLNKVQGRFGKAATLSVMLSSENTEELRKVTKTLAERVAAAKLPHVSSVDWTLRELSKFVDKHGYLYAELDDLKEARTQIDERIQQEKAEASPFDLGLEDDEEKQGESVDDLIKRFQERRDKAEARVKRFPDGFFQHRLEPLIVFFIRTDIEPGQVDDANALLSAVKGFAAEATAGTSVKVDYGGDLMDVLEEVEALAQEIAIATTLTIVLVFVSVYIFFASFRSIPLLGLAMVAPVCLTFAVAELTVDYLNTSTAFLGSIVIGNGINPNIIWLARYFESRRTGMDVPDAVRDAHTGTWAATLSASLAAGLAYMSLVITDFRGFRDFGIIGGVGMVLCWIGAFAILPAFAVLSERYRKIRQVRTTHRTPYGVAFAWLALKAPRAVVWTGIAVTVVAQVLVINFVRHDPMEYDFRRLQSVRDPASRTTWVNKMQGEIVDETTTGSGIAVLLPSRDEVPRIKEQLEQLRAEHPEVIGAVRSVDDVIPTNQKAKIEVLRELRRLLLDARRFASDEEKKRIDKYLPPANLEEIGEADLPETATRMFRELDGTLGRIVFIEHDARRNAWDGAYLVEWSELARKLRLSSGERPPVTGMPPVFADLLDSVRVDGPKAVAAALFVTCLLVFITFRRARDRIFAIGSLLGGILWMAGAMAALKIRLNFLNFVSFPITFGNGVDYGVNFLTRFNQEEEAGYKGEEAARRAVEATGGAVVLCSMTTIFGYISLYASSNQALNSFGAAMAISEVTCVATAICVMPAWLVLRSRKRALKQKPESTASSVG